MSWVKELRRQFPVAEKVVYLDAAYDTGGAQFMREAAQWYFDQWPLAAAQMERGGPGRQRFFDMQDGVRQDIARLLGGVSPEQICFTKNTNEGINMILHGFRYERGDNIVLFENDFPSLVAPAIQAAARNGVECRLVKPSVIHLNRAEDLLGAADANTRIILVSHVQSATGYKIDLEWLGDQCRHAGIFLVVDATQSVGITEIDAGRWGVSAISAASYKGMLGGISAAFLYCRGSLLERVDPVFVSYGDYVSPVVENGVGRIEITRPDAAKKLESGTVDTLGVCVMGSGIKRILEIGVQTIQEHISSLYNTLYSGLDALGYQIVTPLEEKYRSSILAVCPACEKQLLYRHFRAKGVALSCSRYLRFGIPAFATRDDIQAALIAAASTGLR